MKKIFALALVAVVACCGTAKADLVEKAKELASEAKGFYVGGSLGYEHNDQRGTTTNSFQILPEVGYTFNDHWGVGTVIGVDYQHVCGGSSSTLFDFYPYVRWSYLRTHNSLVQLFVDGCAGIGVGDGFTYQIGLKPGVCFNFTPHWSITAHLGFLGYQGANDKAYNAGHVRNGGLYLNFNEMSFGFAYAF